MPAASKPSATKPAAKKPAAKKATWGPRRGMASAPAHDPIDVPSGPATTINADYLAIVQSKLAVIKDRLPEIIAAEPLPLTHHSGDPCKAGFLEPWNPQHFDAHYAMGEKMSYQCGINFLWINSLHSETPFVPINITRVHELANHIFHKPTPMPVSIVIATDFSDSSQLPRGALVHVMPEEVLHAFIFALAGRIEANVDESELAEWTRVVRSTSVTFCRHDTHDARYAAVMNMRQVFGGIARAVTHTARQTVYNVWGFKKMKEARGGSLTSLAISEFYKEHIRMAAGSEPVYSKGAIDASLTLIDRFFSLPEPSAIVKRYDEEMGTQSPFNSIWKQQEIVYRCRKPAVIT